MNLTHFIPFCDLSIISFGKIFFFYCCYMGLFSIFVGKCKTRVTTKKKPDSVIIFKYVLNVNDFFRFGLVWFDLNVHCSLSSSSLPGERNGRNFSHLDLENFIDLICCDVQWWQSKNYSQEKKSRDTHLLSLSMMMIEIIPIGNIKTEQQKQTSKKKINDKKLAQQK